MKVSEVPPLPGGFLLPDSAEVGYEPLAVVFRADANRTGLMVFTRKGITDAQMRDDLCCGDLVDATLFP